VRTWPALEVSRLAGAAPEAPDLLQAALVDLDVVAIAESTPDTWQIFFGTAATRAGAAASLARQFPDLSIVPVDVPDENWVARSQADLRSIRVGGLIVAPPWDVPGLPLPGEVRAGTDPVHGHDPIVVVIRPSMGFGTGHHATTRLCLSAIQGLGLRGRTVVDVGTGSGVLAIAADRLGAAAVVGIDDDPDALQSARENLELNPGAAVTFRQADARSSGMDAFEVVVANLTGALLEAAAPAIVRLAKPGGELVLSGLLVEEEARVRAAYAECLVHNRSQEGEWLCLTLGRP
jgi:ribosomal protein L11 methyltransferase